MRKLAIALIIGLAGAASLSAMDTLSGQMLHDSWIEAKALNDGNPQAIPLQAGFYNGYVDGVVACLNGRAFQIPDGVVARQLFALVGAYLDGHPDEWDQSADSLVARALQQAYPLPSK